MFTTKILMTLFNKTDMKKFIALTLILISTSLSYAQPGNESRKEKIESLKIAFITTELELTTEESEKFWPIYNEMETKLKKIRKEKRQLGEDLKNKLDQLSDADIKTKVNAVLDKDIEESEVKKTYTQKFAEVIGYKKAVKLLSLEQRFKRELLHRMNRPEVKENGSK